MACDATARLYDVDEDSVVYTRLLLTNKYDQATIAFGARNGNLIDLDKLHESIWATRLSGGTRSGLVSLEVTAIGEVAITEDATILKVADSDAEFVLLRNPDDEHAAVFDALQTAAGSSKVLQVSGRIDNYMGRWPSVLATTPDKPRRILVTGFEIAEAE